jgi:hypothetical protein
MTATTNLSDEAEDKSTKKRGHWHGTSITTIAGLKK